MTNPADPHDKFFRSSMQNTTLSEQFFQCYLPAVLLEGLNLKAMKLENSTYIDETLQETVSDLVFTCPYSSNLKRNRKSPDANLILLVEHQSVPDRLMAFRVFHYVFNMLYSKLKQQRKSKSQHKLKLPAVKFVGLN